MASSAQQFAVNSDNYAPVTANPYDTGSEFWNGVGDFFTAGWLSSERDKTNRANDAYNARIANSLEEARLQSARDYEMYMDSTKYQRAVEDIKKAGLNPLLMFGNSLNTSAGASAGAVASHSPAQQKKKENSSSSIISSALKLMAILALK